VFTTTSRDVIFSVTYSVVPLHPVQLFFRFFEVGGANQIKDVFPAITYQTAEMNHIAFDSTVPFDVFRVEVTLIQDNEGSIVYGPGKNDTLVHSELVN
jgi:hypothetical protein